MGRGGDVGGVGVGEVGAPVGRGGDERGGLCEKSSPAVVSLPIPSHPMPRLCCQGCRLLVCVCVSPWFQVTWLVAEVGGEKEPSKESWEGAAVAARGGPSLLTAFLLLKRSLRPRHRSPAIARRTVVTCCLFFLSSSDFYRPLFIFVFFFWRAWK